MAMPGELSVVASNTTYADDQHWEVHKGSDLEAAYGMMKRILGY